MVLLSKLYTRDLEVACYRLARHTLLLNSTNVALKRAIAGLITWYLCKCEAAIENDCTEFYEYTVHSEA